MKKVNGFNIIVKYLGFLKHVPLLPHLFDTQLKLWTLIARPHLLDAIDDIEAEILKWDGTNVGMHKYGGLQFNYHQKEIGHIHSNGLLDIRFNRKIKQQLLLDGRVTDHHIFKKSGWISFYINTDEDRLYAQQLLQIAYTKMVDQPTPPVVLEPMV